MAGEPLVRPARPDDAGAIVAAVRAGFSPELHPLFVYGCAGAARFVADHVARPAGEAERRYTVVEAGGRVVGCTDVVLSADELFLSYVSLLPEARGRGVGSALLLEAVRTSEDGRTRMSLDVLEDNHPAIAWYDGLGFSPVSASEWWEVPLPGSGDDNRATVRGLEQADEVHARYGFSQVEVETTRGTTAVGRLGDGWYRLTRAAALEDDDLLAALARLDAGRRVLAVIPEGSLPPVAKEGARRITATRRLTVLLSELTARLEARRPG